jgi:hypothetical protein
MKLERKQSSAELLSFSEQLDSIDVADIVKALLNKLQLR